MSDDTQFDTPDPIVSTEAIGAIVIAAVTNAIVLLGLDVSPDRQAALIALINTVLAAYVLYHGARVRGARALGSAKKV